MKQFAENVFAKLNLIEVNADFFWQKCENPNFMVERFGRWAIFGKVDGNGWFMSYKGRGTPFNKNWYNTKEEKPGISGTDEIYEHTHKNFQHLIKTLQIPSKHNHFKCKESFSFPNHQKKCTTKFSLLLESGFVK